MAKESSLMQKYIVSALVKTIYASDSDIDKAAIFIEKKLIDNGYVRMDAVFTGFLTHLLRELDDFNKDINKMIKMIGFFQSPLDKIKSIAYLIENQKEKQEANQSYLLEEIDKHDKDFMDTKVDLLVDNKKM